MMALDREKGVIHNLNRILIAALSLSASFMDGVSLQDFLFFVALVLWLWLPECDRIEERLLDKFKKRIKKP
ncbi:hypothetical protein [Pseudoalteromonas marina]|uniref:Uncharacterized protein n=1 Tax=Pseudoalteromonas marina TaxID=267375 RepID=A0ABT9FGA3_9GAMM|nr:hypothetical protein [Pseudoalteromonas marina]MDP2565816.1 hypothetical protein [Pseudoalteromonas marina]